MSCFQIGEAVTRSKMFFKIGALKNFANFTGKHLCWMESLFNKVAGLKRSATLLKRDSTQMFPYEIYKIFCQEKQLAAIFKISMNTQTLTLAKILRIHTLWLSIYYTQMGKSSI